MLNIVLYCAVATGNYGFDVVECYDNAKECYEEYQTLECTKCFGSDLKTICPTYGAVSYE